MQRSDLTNRDLHEALYLALEGDHSELASALVCAESVRLIDGVLTIRLAGNDTRAFQAIAEDPDADQKLLKVAEELVAVPVPVRVQLGFMTVRAWSAEPKTTPDGPEGNGPWTLDLEDQVLKHRTGYRVDFARCTTLPSLTDWVFHLAGKRWLSDADVGAVIRLLRLWMRPGETCYVGPVKDLDAHVLTSLERIRTGKHGLVDPMPSDLEGRAGASTNPCWYLEMVTR